MPKDSLSKRIRDLTRLLALDTLPETTRQEKERALTSLQAEKKASKQTHEIQSMTQRYKMVKFVEHQKAVRNLAKAKKAVTKVGGEDGTALAQAKEEVRRRKVDLVYIENFPVLEKYISLYKDVEGSERVKQRRTEIWTMAARGELKKGMLTTDDGSRERLNKKIVTEETMKEKQDKLEQEEEEVDDFFE
ncbi:rRNA-processing protein efg1 [Taphrina deformans PYCC 5710]|uniref:rRNA-processing protein EFG1 n=1 Tax=Taphrina deformans (strain PYCC 5710 / ATCC 11124 / CBS 356.35 / IMI 108563 / JCM 9778 / NBRC 8474) TaxID=1097556 RepID=R4XPI7_TAPDE|nr:rRNA-processing protein efg1 [Taphrina deformans PYCC 5710]|eukprot:CCG85131.1 rRNA-processing protein efg1 [Taphrina deformans PYCC 5710]